MRLLLLWAIILVSAISTALSEISLFQMFSPPDAESTALAALWFAMPFLAAGGLAILFRKRNAALIVLAISLVIVAIVGVSMLNASATQQEVARKGVENSVGPGEDPNSGPAGMRKAGAESGEMIGGSFSIAICMVLPPMQLLVVMIPSTIAFAATRRRVVVGRVERASA